MPLTSRATPPSIDLGYIICVARALPEDRARPFIESEIKTLLLVIGVPGSLIASLRCE